jgi:hypothetical protein
MGKLLSLIGSANLNLTKEEDCDPNIVDSVLLDWVTKCRQRVGPELAGRARISKLPSEECGVLSLIDNTCLRHRAFRGCGNARRSGRSWEWVPTKSGLHLRERTRASQLLPLVSGWLLSLAKNVGESSLPVDALRESRILRFTMLARVCMIAPFTEVPDALLSASS